MEDFVDNYVFFDRYSVKCKITNKFCNKLLNWKAVDITYAKTSVFYRKKNIYEHICKHVCQ